MASPQSGPDDGTKLGDLEQRLLHTEAKIQTHILTHYESLLQHTARIKTSGSRLHELRTLLQATQTTQDRLRTKIRVPYEHLAMYTRQIEHLHQAADALDAITKYTQLSHRLTLLLARDPTSHSYGMAAMVLSNINELQIQYDFTGVTCVQAQAACLEQLRSQVTCYADAALREGFTKQDTGRLAEGVQIYHHLGQLGLQLRDLLDGEYQQLVTIIDSWYALATTPSDGSSRILKEFWEQLDGLLETLSGTAIKVYTLERVLGHRRGAGASETEDTITKPLGERPTTYYWHRVVDYFRTLFTASETSKGLAQSALSKHYPKLLLRLHSLYSTLAPFQPTTASRGRYEQTPEHMLLRSCFGSFETQYLARLDTRLTNQVQAAFVGPTGDKRHPVVPTSKLTRTLVRTALSELEIVDFDTLLTRQVLHRLTQRLSMFLDQTHKLITTDSRAYFIGNSKTTEAASPAVQLQNLEVAIVVHTLGTELAIASTTYPSLRKVSRAADDACYRILNPLFEHITVTLQGTVAKLYTRSHNTSSSRYTADVVELAHQIRYVRRLCEKLAPVPSVAERVCQLSQRVLQLFIRHVSLLPVREESGKLQLTEDLTQLEFSLNQLLSSSKLALKDLGDMYQAVREFRVLLFMELAQIPSNRATQLSTLPGHVVLHYVLGQAWPILPRPHEALQMNMEDYSDWLDMHSESDIQAHVRRIVNNGPSELDHIMDSKITQSQRTAVEVLQALLDSAN
ncbi:hypothetical protein IWQ62_002896 [Dispira parvispora]|uniref:Conserved oligomeric Golgi complex subunit 5 n=1 Tax=Dispira parvispora TaxID=1520584 RepID=A0A9W8E3E4_9FUNG|nr:hypothetical protein IWQ62_002896 [Dispira parvispora]